MDGKVLASNYASRSGAIPEGCSPDRRWEIIVRISGKELVIVGRNIVVRSGILRRLKKLLLEVVVCRGGGR